LKKHIYCKSPQLQLNAVAGSNSRRDIISEITAAVISVLEDRSSNMNFTQIWPRRGEVVGTRSTPWF